jgi:hypothetical protein
MRIPTAISAFLLSSLASAADPALTVYNQNFAVVRETIPLKLTQGVNQVRFADATALLEPESVMLRDPSGKIALQILEQNYRADPVSVERLLALYEGKTVDFLVRSGDRTEVVTGRIVRSGNVPAAAIAQQTYGYGQPQPAPPAQPIVEVDGKLRFQLPGIPMFPALAGDTVLKPTLDWVIRSSQPGAFDAELCYVSGGLNWTADYNLVAPEKGDTVDLAGWVTIDNNSGKTFENARIKLMAGDVNKLRPRGAFGMGGGVVGGFLSGPTMTPPPITEKSFDDYHLYTLDRPANVRDRETKQVEFVRAAGVKAKVVYVYDGAKIDANRLQGWNWEGIRNDPGFGTQSNTKVWIMRELENSQANRLGMPLPAGRTRFYRRDGDGRLEFTGEDKIEHTPRGETVRVLTGAAFDLVGERRRLNFRIDHQRATVEESFEIKVRNRKSTPEDVRVVEHLYRWFTWEVVSNSVPYRKTDSRTIEFLVPLAPDEEKTIAYAVRYTW